MSKRNFDIPLRCKGIAVVLLKKFDDEYKVLLLKRATPVLRDVWCYIGGSIEEGEIAWQSALREIEEETGITKVSLYTSNKFDQFYSPIENYIYIAPVFVGYVDEEQDVILNYEHSEYKWLSLDQAIDYVTLPGNDEVLTFIEKHFVRNTPTELLRIQINSISTNRESSY
ncbi:NUDIX domain-containing protein [Bacillus sp. IITD106]|nr:NUDIX domain-containing protein [Bacillus sp. IITD106]